MKIKSLYILRNIVTAVVVTMFFSCKNNFGDVQKVGVLQNQPVGEAKNIDLKYTEYQDSTVKLIANLKSPNLLDYSNRPFSFTEFPEGIELIIYGDNNEQTTIFADYAVSYTETDIIDLQGNVIIATQEKDTLFTQQLYYNQQIEWVFTNNPFYFKRTTGYTKGNGFDSDKNLKNFQMLEMGGDFELDN